jgi:hypothetical protein
MLEQIRCEERPARCRELRARTKAISSRVCGSSYARESVPLVDVQVGRHVGGQTSGWGRPSHGLQGEVVHARLLHAHVPKVEALWSQAVGPKERLRGRQVATITPWTRNWRRAHGGERRRHFHAGGEGSLVSLPVVRGNVGDSERLRAVVFTQWRLRWRGHWHWHGRGTGRPVCSR